MTPHEALEQIREKVAFALASPYGADRNVLLAIDKVCADALSKDPDQAVWDYLDGDGLIVERPCECECHQGSPVEHFTPCCKPVEAAFIAQAKTIASGSASEVTEGRR